MVSLYRLETRIKPMFPKRRPTQRAADLEVRAASQLNLNDRIFSFRSLVLLPNRYFFNNLRDCATKASFSTGIFPYLKIPIIKQSPTPLLFS